MDEELLSSGLDELIVRLGGQLLSADVSLGPEEEARGRQYGSSWLAERWESIRRQLCGTVGNRLTGDLSTDIGAVADVLSATFHGPVVFTVSAIVVKYGVERLCRGGEAP
ncbi:hypothetical protein [Streptomyces sp. NPDC087856]|uniref:hypothetical protein n=1 Tax=Streptomyces sp. NPDC087856 TaxID=3365811 RepID=UPI0038031974